MHEWALAESIINAVVEVAKKENTDKVTEIDIVVGELQTIDLEILKYALDALREGTVASEAKINFIDEKPKLRCNVCGYEWIIEDLKEVMKSEEIESVHFIPELVHVFISCPNCGSSDFEVIAGRGIYIKSIRVEKHA
ncbi:MAG: hydrogenase nickel incorporation protein HypA [Candidatus Njordarchaeota archaeon]